MPADNRRLSVPSETKAPQIYITQKKNVIRCADRQDGRTPKEIRPIFIRTGIVSAAKGSAYLEMNKTKVLCSVFGPRETLKRQDFNVNGKLVCDFKFAPFSCVFRRQHQQDSEEKELSTLLREALEPALCLFKFPKSTIDVFVLVIENDGSCLSEAITCASAALADSGIDMYDIIVGNSLKQAGNYFFVDPTFEEENSASASPDCQEGNITVAWMPSLQQVAAVFQNGNLKAETLVKGIESLIDVCKTTKLVVQNCLLDSVEKSLKEQNEDQLIDDHILESS